MTSFKASILVVEDDPFLGPGLVRFLEKHGYEARLETQGSKIICDLQDFMDRYDLVVLDLMLPDIAGESLLDRIKEAYPGKPVLILTAKGRLENKEECFSKGADDYLVKPFEVMELLLRIDALIRRFGLNKTVMIGDVFVNIDLGFVRKDGKEYRLSGRSLDLLKCLLKKRGKLVSRQEILDTVWKDTVVTDESIRTYIKELRKVLPENAISTFKGRGYLLN